MKYKYIGSQPLRCRYSENIVYPNDVVESTDEIVDERFEVITERTNKYKKKVIEEDIE